MILVMWTQNERTGPQILTMYFIYLYTYLAFNFNFCSLMIIYPVAGMYVVDRRKLLVVAVNLKRYSLKYTNILALSTCASLGVYSAIRAPGVGRKKLDRDQRNTVLPRKYVVPCHSRNALMLCMSAIDHSRSDSPGLASKYPTLASNHLANSDNTVTAESAGAKLVLCVTNASGEGDR